MSKRALQESHVKYKNIINTCENTLKTSKLAKVKHFGVKYNFCDQETAL